MIAPPSYTLPKDFVALTAMSELFEGEKAKLSGPDIHPDWLNLRHQSQKPLREAWHAYMFAACYAHCRQIPFGGMLIKPEATEYSFRDATLMWGTPGEPILKNLQMKELPPAHRSKEAQLEDILAGVAKKYRAAYDLVVAIYLNREQRFESVRTPPLEIAELWMFGFKDPEHTTIFMKGMTRSGDVDHIVPWRSRPIPKQLPTAPPC